MFVSNDSFKSLNASSKNYGIMDCFIKANIALVLSDASVVSVRANYNIIEYIIFFLFN